MRIIPVVFAAVMVSAKISPALAGAEPYVGERMVSAFSFCPKGYAPMNGQLLPLAQNTALFSLLGTNYGGNGTSNFALPTAKPITTATGAALTQCIALEGIFPPRGD